MRKHCSGISLAARKQKLLRQLWRIENKESSFNQVKKIAASSTKIFLLRHVSQFSLKIASEIGTNNQMTLIFLPLTLVSRRL